MAADKAKQKQHAWHKARRAKLHAAGLCNRCGVSKFVEDHHTCEACLEKQRKAGAINRSRPIYKVQQKKRRAKLHKKARNAGLCGRCHTQQVVSGMASCLICIKYANKVREEARKFVYAIYGNKCSCKPCGEGRWQFLTLDHINNDGARHRKVASTLVGWAKRNGCPTTLRLLCWNCNSGRERNGGTCPHLTNGPRFCDANHRIDDR